MSENYEQLFNSMIDPSVDDGPRIYASKLRGHKKIRHRHRHTKAQRRDMLQRHAVAAVTAFTRVRMAQSGFARMLFSGDAFAQAGRTV